MPFHAIDFVATGVAMSETVTPMMAQYLALKAKADDCLLFYRMGDFFELFFDDAKLAAQILDIAPPRAANMAGPPSPCAACRCMRRKLSGAADQGRCRVAIAEQVETPNRPKSAAVQGAGDARHRALRHRGHADRALLEPRRANVLAAVCLLRGAVGIASVDISTGRMELEEASPEQFGAALARLGASEVVARFLGRGPLDAIPRSGRIFQRGRRGAAVRHPRRRDAGWLWHLHPRDAGGGLRPHRLSRPCGARQAAAAAAPGGAQRRGASGDGRGDTRISLVLQATGGGRKGS
jgi:DNA mismatch repair protein MutS